MKTFYCVTTSFDDRGKVSAAITSTVQAELIPESTFTRTCRRDVYHDWFETIEQAEEFVEEARNA